MKKLFIKFLKKHKAYESFMYNCKLNCKKSLDKFINNNTADSYIDFAFTWINTKEGWEYWHKLHKQWNMTLSKL